MRRLLALPAVWLALLVPACSYDRIDRAGQVLTETQLAYARCAARQALSYAHSSERPELIARAAMSACPVERNSFRNAMLDLWRGDYYRADYDITRSERRMRDDMTDLVVRARLERERGADRVPPPSPSGMF